MADFECPVVKIEEVIPIDGADRIEAVRIGGYRSIVEKGVYKVGDLAVYIPCGSVVPMEIQEELGLVGKLSGSRKDRVKEIKLKGVLSEGLVYPCYLADKRAAGDTCEICSVMEGQDVAEILGITKYEPQLPATMMGRVKPYPFTMNYDIENIKKHPNVLYRGEIVAISEKIHGTLLQVGLVHLEDGTKFKFVTSKGLGKAGLIIQDVPENQNNLYLQTAKAYGLLDKLEALDMGQDLYLFGEIYGVGIQDLGYDDMPRKALWGNFRAFDIYEGKKNRGSFMDYGDFLLCCESTDIPTVNYLFFGPYMPEVLANLTNGKETMSDKDLHLREGCVVRPVRERSYHESRVIYKSVSEAYLLRKNGTEYN